MLNQRAQSPTVWSGGISFTHSVASGDPWDTSVLLWTRATPTGGTALESVPVCVSWSVAPSSSELSTAPTAKGQAFTSYDVDWTVKIEATGLTPDTKYSYQFGDCTNPDAKSPVGTTRTLPSPDTPAGEVNGGNPLKIGVFSCSNYPGGWSTFLLRLQLLEADRNPGYFNAYGVAALNVSVDIFVHLGDYVSFLRFVLAKNAKKLFRYTKASATGPFFPPKFLITKHIRLKCANRTSSSRPRTSHNPRLPSTFIPIQNRRRSRRSSRKRSMDNCLGRSRSS